MLELVNRLTTARGDQRYIIPFISVSLVSASIEIGDCLYILDSPVQSMTGCYYDNLVYPATKADPKFRNRMPSIGVLISKSEPLKGIVQYVGIVRDVYSGLENGAMYKIGYNSKPVKTIPEMGTIVAGEYLYQQDFGMAIGENELLLSNNFSLKIRRYPV